MRDTEWYEQLRAVSALYFCLRRVLPPGNVVTFPDVGRRVAGRVGSLGAANRYCCFFGFLTKIIGFLYRKHLPYSCACHIRFGMVVAWKTDFWKK